MILLRLVSVGLLLECLALMARQSSLMLAVPEYKSTSQTPSNVPTQPLTGTSGGKGYLMTTNINATQPKEWYLSLAFGSQGPITIADVHTSTSVILQLNVVLLLVLFALIL
ncbi:hypothetical protein PROFUN_09473 [Planoprotostelium fungivorum]|uniref:Uncharacterized protein n=1 Tax=Planoprotostelium fungivorum TaxID=1890364 RepID=A0A2P6NH44_9EUKA|nr:hypothetical protein PROFUN_09473 [Planoprotostelium fungivorum]